MGFPVRRLWLPCLLVSLTVATCDDTPLPPGHQAIPVPSVAPSRPPSQTSGTWRPPDRQSQPVDVVITESDFLGPAGLLLPRPDLLNDWVYLYHPSYYSAENLYELIDGGADAYLGYGFEQAVNAVLRLREPEPSINREVTLELTVYSMTSPAAARGKFDEDHHDGPCETLEAYTLPHCLTASSLDMVIDRHYLRLLLDHDHPSLRQPLLAVSDRIRASTQQADGSSTPDATSPRQ